MSELTFYKQQQNISLEIADMFNSFSGEDTLGSKSLPYVKTATGFKWDGFNVEQKIYYEPTEYLLVVAKMYGKDMAVCARCETPNNYKHLEGRRAFQCRACGYQTYPTANTIFQKTTTPLKEWFKTIKYLSLDTMSYKQIERSTGVSYTTAMRMGRLIKCESFYSKIQTFANHIRALGEDFEKYYVK